MAGQQPSSFRVWLGYGLYAAIAGVCAVMAYHAGPTVLGAVVGTPGAVALVSIPWQLFRDQRAHERSLELVDRNTAVAIGLTSPMAQTAFSQYVEFATKYTQAMTDIVVNLVREGPRGEHLQHTNTLYTIRRDYVLWIPLAVEDQLKRLEDALWQMSVDAQSVALGPSGDGWKQRYAAMYKAWAQIIGLNYHPPFPEIEADKSSEADEARLTLKGAEESDEANLQRFVHLALRKTLGTDDYADIRSLAIRRALGQSDADT